MNNVPIFGFSDPISSWSHFFTALMALTGSYFLMVKGRGNSWRVLSLGVYAFSLIFLFSMSGVFHLLPREGLSRAVMQRLDHAGIWILIAGTFTPLHAILFRGKWRWLILLCIWTIAITGLVLEIVFFKDFPEWLALSFFLGMGWIGKLSDYKFRKSYPQHSPRLIIFGGLSYSIGAIIDFTRWPILWYQYIGPHEVFHFFVTLGAFCHWLFIYKWCDHPISDKFICDVKIYSENDFVLNALNDRLYLSAKSLNEIKEKALAQIQKRYHQKPTYEVFFRYFHEEKTSSDKF
ncbi:MAG: hemolysin III family protein [Deltaproteobacteria bacterium]|jgi:channel protein (hemolysin III family)|nr:hemolysin III family protein [Deltaproteobacteria bacterium]